MTMEFFCWEKYEIPNVEEYFWDLENIEYTFSGIICKKYIWFLDKTIGIIAVMRLAIDPYPILLMDEEVLLRCFDSMTEAYEKEFVRKYITEETVNDYKKTEIYLNHYNAHMSQEKKNIAVFQIMKYQVIDTTEKEEIMSQIHLLDKADKIATYIAFSSEKIVKIYTYGGFQMYFTDIVVCNLKYLKKIQISINKLIGKLANKYIKLVVKMIGLNMAKSY